MAAETETPVIDRLQLKRITLAVGVAAEATEQALLDPHSLVRPNKRGRIAVAKAEEWLGPQLKSLDPPKKQLSPDEKVVQTITVDLSTCVYGHKLSSGLLAIYRSFCEIFLCERESACIHRLGSTGAQVLACCLQAPPLQPHEASDPPAHGVTELDLSGCGLGDTAIGASSQATLQLRVIS